MLPFQGALAGGWRVGGILNARSGVPINVTINRPDTVTVGGVTVTNVPGGNTRGTQRPDLVPGVDPYLKDGVRWLNPGRLRRAAARHVRQPAAQLPARPELLAGRSDTEQGLPLQRQTQGSSSGSSSSTSRTT